jgi:hypothetical protein
MTPNTVLGRDWPKLVAMLGGAEALRSSAVETKAFRRARKVASAADLLRLVLAYCLGRGGLRLTAAWAGAIGLADLSNPALLQRLRQCGDWLTLLIGQALAAGMPAPCRGRLIRLIDATSVPKAGAAARRGNRVWRIHAAFDLPAERFGAVQLTDGGTAERLDRIAVVPGEIRVADRAHLHPDAIANVCADGADVVVRTGWKSARWRDAADQPVRLPDLLRAATATGWIDQPIWLARNDAAPLKLRLVARRKSDAEIAEARRKVRRAAQRQGEQPSQASLLAADWVMLITSLPANEYGTETVLLLYRLRWRIELAFKRLKSVVGLHGPPGKDDRSARPYLLAHLLTILLLEPLVDALEDSPRWAPAV